MLVERNRRRQPVGGGVAEWGGPAAPGRLAAPRVGFVAVEVWLRRDRWVTARGGRQGREAYVVDAAGAAFLPALEGRWAAVAARLTM